MKIIIIKTQAEHYIMLSEREFDELVKSVQFPDQEKAWELITMFTPKLISIQNDCRHVIEYY
jgi:hypothetical protein